MGTKIETPYVGPLEVRWAFTDKNSHPLLLDLLLIKEFGPQYLGWEPETLWIEITRKWRVTPSESNRSKIQAIRTVHLVDTPFERWEVFELVSSGLMGMAPRFDMVQRPTPHRAAATADIMLQTKEKQTFSKEVARYLAAVLLDHGMVYGPGALEPANKYVAKFVDPRLQETVKEAIAQGHSAREGAEDVENIQLMKSLSVKDFAETVSRMLLSQMNKLL